MPVEVEHLWSIFCALDASRSVGMASNPISYVEIEAYCRLVWGGMTPWEVATILAVDKAVRGTASSKTKQPVVRTEADVSDGAGVSALMRGLGAKKATTA